MDTLVQFHIDESERAEAADICTALGIDLPSYLRMCTSRLVRERGIRGKQSIGNIAAQPAEIIRSIERYDDFIQIHSNRGLV